MQKKPWSLVPRLLLPAALFAALLAPPLAPEASAQVTRFSVANFATDDVDVALLIRYVGAQASGTVAVTAGDLLLKHGALAAEIADTTVTGCGGTAGTLDVDNAACDTLGELVDKINASANWRAVRLDGIRADVTAAATLNALAATQATSEDGLGLVWDTSVAFTTTRLLAPPPFRSMRAYLYGTQFNVNPWLGRTTCVTYMSETTTFGSGTSAARLLTEQPGFAAVEAQPTVTTVALGAGGATTVAKDFVNFIYQPFCGNENERVLLRVANSAAMSAVSLVGVGRIIPNGAPY